MYITRLKLLLFFILTYYQGTAQNIITNPDFSEYIICPDSYSRTAYCKGWYQPTKGTSDYFHTCATGTQVHVPTNFAGNQEDSSGAYLGFYGYMTSDYREYVGTTFPAMKRGNKYKIKTKIVLAKNSKWATDGLGIHFSTYRIDDSMSFNTLLVRPQIQYGTISDTNWVELTDYFIADSAYTNLVVGCLKTITDVKGYVVNSSTSWNIGYYYLGELSIEDLNVFVNLDTLDTPITPINIDTVKYALPNAFTPNGDGKNDIFRLISTDFDKYADYELRVFNRWGECVYFTDDINSGWNGNWQNQPSATGVYFYFVKFTRNKVKKIVQGDFTLIR